VPGCKFDDEIAVLVYKRIGNTNDSTTAFTAPARQTRFRCGPRCRTVLLSTSSTT
jgi:hypothetical protein